MDNNFITLLESLRHNNINFEKDNFSQKLNLIEDKIKELFSLIRITKNLDEAQPFFEILADIQFVLANLSFAQNLSLTERLDIFVHDFERLDDIELLKFLYKKIQKESDYIFKE